MKKEALNELVNGKYPSMHRLEVDAWIGLAWGQLLYEVYKMDPSNVDFYCKNYTDVAVSKDDQNQYYCTLPVRPVQLPDNADGVRRVMYTKDSVSVMFTPVPRDAFGVFNELDVNKVATEVSYSTRFDKIVWERDPGVTSVQMDIVPMYADYDDEDEVTAPMGFEVRLLFFVEQLLATGQGDKYWQTMTKDKINN